ncbi:MAG: cupin domain-containing protein, partial [Cohaesibacter sp.]|nr:cupin domain-containing protein [Cohaesibacter sp.]
GHEVYDIQLADHGSLQSQPHARGTREQLIVLEGAVSIQSGTVSENLVQGDTARYPVDVPHSISSLDGPARVFLIVKNS